MARPGGQAQARSPGDADMEGMVMHFLIVWIPSPLWGGAGGGGAATVKTEPPTPSLPTRGREARG